MPRMIAVHCDTPLVPTFKFSKAEFYCRRCHRALAMFDGDVLRVPETPELIALAAANEELFREESAACIARGMRRGDCEKCSAGEFHSEHCGAEARQKSDEAYQRLLTPVES